MPAATATGSVPSGAAIASAFLKYATPNVGYVYGGRADRPGDWDCSSAVSYVLGHDLGMTLPGGKHYGDPGVPPNSHGPVVMDYFTWAGATTMPAGQPPAMGDLCIWAGLGPLGHIGVAISSTEMVSALDHVDGTKVTGFQGPTKTMTVRRVNGAGQVPGGVGVAGLPGGVAGRVARLPGAGIVAGLVVGAGVPLVMVGVILAGTVLLGLAGAAVVTAAIRSQR